MISFCLSCKCATSYVLTKNPTLSENNTYVKQKSHLFPSMLIYVEASVSKSNPKVIETKCMYIDYTWH